jgi:LysM repeat protein
VKPRTRPGTDRPNPTAHLAGGDREIITMPKHRAPRYVRTKKVIARAPVAAGATVVGLGVLSSPASAHTGQAGQPGHDWSGVAQCMSSSDWSTNTGNGQYGGLQFKQSTWAGFGGTEFAPRADLATPAQQVEIAERVLDGQGPGAWAGCGRYLAEGATAAAAAAPAAEPAAEAPADDAATEDYTVRWGDTVKEIAAAHQQSWQELYQRNADVIGSDPHRIHPGQVLAVSGGAPAAEASAPGTATVGASAPAPAVAPVAEAAPQVASATAVITNTAGPVRAAVQAAANAVVSAVPGAGDITIGGTRASATDMNGHPAGRALDYMVMSDNALGDAIAQYHVDHWDELGVEYVIWEQKILTSPDGAWKAMEDRGSVTANHFDHVHVNYVS